MTHALKESLEKLLCLSPDKLFKTSKRIRSEYGSTEWKLSLCLLAAVRTGLFKKLGFATITEYAEKALQLSGKKTKQLLSTASTLEHLPLLSEAFQKGQIGWGKLRAIRGIVTPETEKAWLEFALAHRTDEVVSKVTLSPSSWKRHLALQASLKGKPVATKEAVQKILEEPKSSTCQENGQSQKSAQTTVIQQAVACRSQESLPTVTSEPESALMSPTHPNNEVAPAVTPPPLPSPPKIIRVTFDLTPDEYALYERAESRIRSQAQRRLSRSKVLAKMAEQVLEAGTARSRAKYLVLIHTDKDGEMAWYDTEKGPLPVAPEVLEEALKTREPMRVGSDDSDGEKSSDSKAESTSEIAPLDGADSGDVANSGPETNSGDEVKPFNKATSDDEEAEYFDEVTSGDEAVADLRQPGATVSIEALETGRTAIPNQTLRTLFAKASHRCQRCHALSPFLEVHHKKPVSEGGDNDPDTLQVLCHACHALTHEPDYATKPKWRAAREAVKKRRKVGKRSEPDGAVVT